MKSRFLVGITAILILSTGMWYVSARKGRMRDVNDLVVDAEKGAYSQIPQVQQIVGYWECLVPKNPELPHTGECALGIAVDQSDGHYVLDTSAVKPTLAGLPMGTKVRVAGTVISSQQLPGYQKYNVDGLIKATAVEKI